MLWDKSAFSKFEMEENLFERTYNGVPYWQMLRFMVCEGAYSDRIEKEDFVAQKTRKKRAVSMLLQYPAAYLRMVWKFCRLRPCDVICFRHIKNSDQRHYFIDTWEMPPEIKVLMMDEIITKDTLSCKDTCSIVVPFLKSQLKYYLRKLSHLQKKDGNEYDFLKQLEKKVREKFGRSVSAERMEQQIFRYVETNMEFERYYRALFQKVKCKAIVVAQYYQDALYPAYRVAKEFGIRVIELQHGVISNHEEYWFEDQRGLNNYTPDYFLAFGDAHITWIKLLPNTRAIPVGFPYQNQQIKKWDDLETQEKTIIVYPRPEPAFEKLIEEFVKLAAPAGYRVIVKLHPLEAGNAAVYYPLLSNNERIELVTDQTKDIYYWLKIGKYHVMADTTVGLEAVAFDHTNICIATNVSHIQTQPLLDWGVARGFSTADELMQLVKNPESDKKQKMREGLWKSNAQENIQSFFTRMKEQNWPRSQDYIA